MMRYEVLILTAPSITEDEGRGIEKGLEQLVKGVKGDVISFERWGKYRLSYPVRRNDYGIYYLARFAVDANVAFFKEVDAFLAVKNHELIMRHCLVKLAPKQSLEYKRPLNVEEAPAHDADTFLKEGGRGRENRRGPGGRDGFRDRSERGERGERGERSSTTIHEELPSLSQIEDESIDNDDEAGEGF